MGRPRHQGAERAGLPEHLSQALTGERRVVRTRKQVAGPCSRREAVPMAEDSEPWARPPPAAAWTRAQLYNAGGKLNPWHQGVQSTSPALLFQTQTATAMATGSSYGHRHARGTALALRPLPWKSREGRPEAGPVAGETWSGLLRFTRGWASVAVGTATLPSPAQPPRCLPQLQDAREQLALLPLHPSVSPVPARGPGQGAKPGNRDVAPLTPSSRARAPPQHYTPLAPGSLPCHACVTEPAITGGNFCSRSQPTWQRPSTWRRAGLCTPLTRAARHTAPAVTGTRASVRALAVAGTRAPALPAPSSASCSCSAPASPLAARLGPPRAPPARARWVGWYVFGRAVLYIMLTVEITS